MNAAPHVAVLMSTYNGSEYLEEQIDSILKQEDVDVSLYVRDDGSTDKTIEILQRFAKSDDITLIVDGNKLGAANSFMQLFYHVHETAPSQFYAFADQDDIWLPDKLAHALEFFSGVTEPMLYGSNQTILKHGKPAGLRYTTPPEHSFVSSLFSNRIAGCTMVFNAQLADVVAQMRSRPSFRILNMRMHDTWMILAAMMHGPFYYDHNSKILYRIHDSNAVGDKGDNASLLTRTRMIANVLRAGGSIHYRSAYAAELLQCFPGVSGQQREVLEAIAHYKDGFNRRIALIMNKEIRSTSGGSSLSFACKVMAGII